MYLSNANYRLSPSPGSDRELQTTHEPRNGSFKPPPNFICRFWIELHRVTTRQTEKLVPDSKLKLSDTYKLQHGGTD